MLIVRTCTSADQLIPYYCVIKSSQIHGFPSVRFIQSHHSLRQDYTSPMKTKERITKLLPDDNNDAVEYVVRVLDVSKQAEGQQHEAHLQDKHAGENDVADLQHVSQLLGLGEERKRARDRGGEELASLIYSIPRSRAPLRRHVRAAVRCNQPVN